MLAHLDSHQSFHFNKQLLHGQQTAEQELTVINEMSSYKQIRIRVNALLPSQCRQHEVQMAVLL